MLQGFFQQARDNQAARERWRSQIEVIKDKIDYNKIVPVYAFMTCFFERGEEGRLINTPMSKYMKDFVDHFIRHQHSVIDHILASGGIPPLPIPPDKIKREDAPFIETARNACGRRLEGTIESDVSIIVIDESGSRDITPRRPFYGGAHIMACLRFWDHNQSVETLDSISETLIKAGKGAEAVKFWERVQKLHDYSDLFPNFPRIWKDPKDVKREPKERPWWMPEGINIPGIWGPPKPAGQGA